MSATSSGGRQARLHSCWERVDLPSNHHGWINDRLANELGSRQFSLYVGVSSITSDRHVSVRCCEQTWVSSISMPSLMLISDSGGGALELRGRGSCCCCKGICCSELFCSETAVGIPVVVAVDEPHNVVEAAVYAAECAVPVAVVVLKYPSITGADVVASLLGGGTGDASAVSAAWLVSVDCWNI